MSKGEAALYALLQELYPNYVVLRQVPIKQEGVQMYLDLYIAGLRLAFEVQGPQHNKYVPFFHKSKSGLERALAKDALKADYCRENGIMLVTISNKEITESQLHAKIKEATDRFTA